MHKAWDWVKESLKASELSGQSETGQREGNNTKE
jgi:hypothetical protein